jgi:hypothetical protein
MQPGTKMWNYLTKMNEEELQNLGNKNGKKNGELDEVKKILRTLSDEEKDG